MNTSSDAKSVINSAKQYIEVGVRHYHKQHYQMALYAFEQAVICSSTSVRALHGKGVVLVQMGKYREALKSFEQASTLAPHITQIHLDLAEATYLFKDYEKSGSGYRKAIELDSTYQRTPGNRQHAQRVFFEGGRPAVHAVLIER